MLRIRMTQLDALLVLVFSCRVTTTVGWLTSAMSKTTRERTWQSPALISCLDTFASLFGFSVSNEDDPLQSKTNEAEMLRKEARRLRQEVEEFEKRKASTESAGRKEVQAKLETLTDQYSIVVPILKPDGTTKEENVQFPPRLNNVSGESGSSSILVCEATLPLGILLGEHESLEGMTKVDEVLAGSNGDKAGIREGDLLRACTACKVEMVRRENVQKYLCPQVPMTKCSKLTFPKLFQEQPTWQLMAGGIGRPKTVRFMFSTDFKPFELVLEAVSSNRMDPQGRAVLLVLERNRPHNV
jgi:hypothetical protein